MVLPDTSNERRQNPSGTIITPQPPNIPVTILPGINYPSSNNNNIFGNVGTQPTSSPQQSRRLTPEEYEEIYTKPEYSGGYSQEEPGGGGSYRGRGGGRTRIQPSPSPTPVTSTPTQIPTTTIGGGNTLRRQLEERATAQRIRKELEMTRQLKGGTEQTQPRKLRIDIINQPTLIQRPIGYFRDPETGDLILSQTEIRYFDPVGKSLGGGAFVSTEYPAPLTLTGGRSNLQGEVIISPEKRTTIDIAKGTIRKGIYESKRIGKQLQEGYGTTQESARDIIGVTKIPSLIEPIGEVSSSITPIRLIPGGKEAFKGVVTGGLKQVVDRPLENIGLYGGGRLIGFGTKATIYGFKSAFPTLSKSRYVTGTAKSIGYGLLGTTTGFEILRISQNERPYEEFGRTSVQYSFLGKGIKDSGKSLEKKYFVSSKEPEFKYAKDIIQPIISEERVIDVGVYGIQTRVPPKVIYSDTGLKESLRDFGFKGRFVSMKVEKEIPEYNILTTGSVVSEEGKIIYSQAVTGREGKSLAKINVLEGFSKKYTPEYIKQKLVELDLRPLSKELSPSKLNVKYNQVLKGTTPIQQYQLEKLSKGVFEKNVDYYLGEIKVTNAFRKTQTGGTLNINIYPKGKRTTIYTSASRTKQIYEKEGEFSSYITELNLKDITKPGYRRTKLLELRGESVVLEPISIGGEEGSVVVGGRTKLKSIKRDTSTITAIKLQQTKQLSTSLKKSLSSQKYMLNRQSQIELPVLQVRGQTQTTSRITTLTEQPRTGRIRPSEQVVNSFIERENVILKNPVITKTSNKLSPVVWNKYITKTSTKLQLALIDRQIIKQQPRLITKQPQKQIQKLSQKLIYKTTFGGRAVFGGRTTPPPKVPPIVPLPFGFGGQSNWKGQRFKQPTSYLPSFTALSLNIRSKKKDVLAGGLRVRAILD